MLKQLQDFKKSQSIIKHSQDIMEKIKSTSDISDVMILYQRFVLNLTRNNTFSLLVNSDNSNSQDIYRVNTLSDGKLDEFRFFFNNDNKDIVPMYCQTFNKQYDLNLEELHSYYSECLDSDPANAEYLYNVIKTYYQKRDYMSSLSLCEKYLLLNDNDRKFNKINVLVIAIKICANVYHRYDDAVTYAGDMLSIIDTDFAKPKQEKGFAYFHKDLQDQQALTIFIVAGACYASFASKSDFYQNKLSRLKMALVLLKRAEKIDDNNFEVLTLLARVHLLSNGNYVKAEKLLLRSLGENRNQPIAISAMAVCQFLSGKPKVGFKILEKALKENKHIDNSTHYNVLLPTIKALISYYYEREKRGFNEHYNRHKVTCGVHDDVDEYISSDEDEIYDSDDEAEIKQASPFQIKKTVRERSIRAKNKSNPAEEVKRENSSVDPSDISIDLGTQKSHENKAIEFIEDAIRICNKTTADTPENEALVVLDLVQLHVVKLRILIGLDQLKAAHEYFYNTFTDLNKKAFSLDIFVIEAELILKVEKDNIRAKDILERVLSQDTLHFRALLLLSYINIFSEGKYQKALDSLLKAKLIEPRSHELWNLLGHAYSFIDGVSDKAEE